MSSPSIPVVPPADLDEVVVYDSGGEEFERRRHASVRDQSLVHGGGGGFSGGSEADQVLSCVAEGKGGVLGSDSGEASSLPTLGGGTEQALEVRGLQECLMQMEGQPTGEAEGRGRVPEGDALWVELEAARWREDWLANKAALGCTGILCWVREHRVLLDGASKAFASIQDSLAQGSTAQPPELQQGMAQLERLLAGHQQCNAVALGSWWEVAADAGEALLGLAEVLAVVRAQIEVDLGVGLPGGPGRE
ncbi:hypothetical protein J132_03587 [Termitomyces sp. J132]|nr:hypothetical protein J132_03587 [Termitomyces sp. J132]